MTQLDFWFSVGSTYTYLTAVRIERLAALSGVAINWIPFNIREILAPIGGPPFPDSKPQKTAYMWRDIERRARWMGRNPLLPAAYPLQHFELANRLATLASVEGWCAEYTALAYELWFEHGIPPGDDRSTQIVANRYGKSAEELIRRANLTEIKDTLDENTDKARAVKIFGAPSFVANGELFWGDDQLERAIEWVVGHGEPQAPISEEPPGPMDSERASAGSNSVGKHKGREPS